MFRYSLAQVRVDITRKGNSTISFGGNKSMLGSITFSRSTERFSVTGDATGGYIVNENLDATGEVTISIRQFAPLVRTLTNLFNSYDQGEGYGIGSKDQGAVTITAYYGDKKAAIAKGCFLNMSELVFGEEAEDRDFTFIAGEVNFEISALPKSV